jgi:hypothetical protein
MMRSPLFFLAFLVALVAVVTITQQSDENVGEPNVFGVIKTFFAKGTGRAVSTSKSSSTRRFVNVSAIVLPPPLVASASPAFYQTISSFFFTDQPLSIKEDDNDFVVSKRLASTVDPAKLRVEVHREEFGDVFLTNKHSKQTFISYRCARRLIRRGNRVRRSRSTFRPALTTRTSCGSHYLHLRCRRLLK